jgi:carbon-monoxide dehydrogenase small subunit
VPETTIGFRVNGQEVSVQAHPMARLLDVLREQLHLTGTKEGCGEGECGACAVFINDVLVNSCLVPVIQAAGADVFTIEGVARADALDALQQAFVAHGGAQCGICTPGMIMAARALLEKTPEPSEEQIREGLAGNLCRCTGYMRIFEAVKGASQASGNEASGNQTAGNRTAGNPAAHQHADASENPGRQR